jgi:NurA domain
MAVDFQQVANQVKALGEKAVQRTQEIKELRQQAFTLLEEHAADFDALVQRVERITRLYDPHLRCAIPPLKLGSPPEPLNQRVALPNLPKQATLLAADGSQIYPDRHAQVNFCLINVGAIQLQIGVPEAPELTIESQLMYDDELFMSGGVLTETQVALKRDLSERRRLFELAKQAPQPVITFTDGPMELWGPQDSLGRQSFEEGLKKYHEVLHDLRRLGATTAGYVDKPSANLVVRLLEIATLEEENLPEIREYHPLQRVSDRQLFQGLIEPGERSAVFAIQSSSTQHYQDELALHFFYLNVGRAGRPWLARVEVPAWVAGDPQRLDALHAVLYNQCQIMGSRPFPYLIHRAHEAAVVSMEEKEQVTQMIVAELLRSGISVDEVSYKQSAKDLGARKRYER